MGMKTVTVDKDKVTRFAVGLTLRDGYAYNCPGCVEATGMTENSEAVDQIKRNGFFTDHCDCGERFIVKFMAPIDRLVRHYGTGK